MRAVSQAELSVAELVNVLGLPQSTVSRHLKPLRDSGILDTRREGTSIYYRRGEAFADATFAQFIGEQVGRVEAADADAIAVRKQLDVRKQRSREFFDRVAGRYSRLTEPGGGWSALAALLAAGFSGQTVADLGAGEGDLTLLLARYAKSVTAVDASPEMLRHVKQQAGDAGLLNRIRLVEGDLERLPLPDASCDAVFLSQALHHAARPDAAVSEAARIAKRGGLVLLVDLARHEQDWVREQWADQWLGFEERELEKWFNAAGVEKMHHERLSGATPDIDVMLWVGRKG